MIYDGCQNSMNLANNINFAFTFSNLSDQYKAALANRYEFITCVEFVNRKPLISQDDRIVVNRVDIDFSVKKAGKLLELFNSLNIKASFFVRLHAKEYNPFAFEEYRILKSIVESGHELGYHSEIVDQAAIWNEDPAVCLTRDLKVMEEFWGHKIRGVASHGGMTGLNNLDFWAGHKPKDFGLLYEGYDKEPEFNLFQESLYISDSNWTSWKCYLNGVVQPEDKRSFGEHLSSDPRLVYLLIHPDTYYESHFYE